MPSIKIFFIPKVLPGYPLSSGFRLMRK
jgi:hypothetical protein